MASSVVFGYCVIATSLFLALGLVSAQPRAFFVFGDSLVDSGNNDFLATSARADAPPYGIDYPTHKPTGRFSNGLNIPDLISMSFIACLLTNLNVQLIILFWVLTYTICMCMA